MSAGEQKKNRKKLAKRARHRLMSIHHDVESFVRPTLAALPNIPVFANERCGSWYAYHFVQNNASCYFKSTDGHTGTWNFSLKRLNLNIVRSACEDGGCVILDASASKQLPDSFSRTIPIWATVLNRITVRYRAELGIEPMHSEDWDRELYLPDFVPNEEGDQIRRLLDDRVETLHSSNAIVDPYWLVSTLTKPLRPFWITPQHLEATTTAASFFGSEDCFPLICINCSQFNPNDVNTDEHEFVYTPGAADDHESWARHLRPRLFWDNIDQILTRADNADATDLAIDSVVQQELHVNETFSVTELDEGTKLFDNIGNTGIAIGTRRAGRPPDCWKNFDAILNVTDLEYPDMFDKYNSLESDARGSGFYLQMPVKEGKRDRSELERWMAVGTAFVFRHAQQKRRILIHCAQGKDRSVAMGMCIVSLFCNLVYPLQWREDVWNRLSLNDLAPINTNDGSSSFYGCAGLPQQLVETLLGQNGRDILTEWVQRGLYPSATDNLKPLATKESLRIALLLIQQDREKADPTRSTMQKLNRFFMSKSTHDNTSKI